MRLDIFWSGGFDRCNLYPAPPIQEAPVGNELELEMHYL